MPRIFKFLALTSVCVLMVGTLCGILLESYFSRMVMLVGLSFVLGVIFGVGAQVWDLRRSLISCVEPDGWISTRKMYDLAEEWAKDMIGARERGSSQPSASQPPRSGSSRHSSTRK